MTKVRKKSLREIQLTRSRDNMARTLNRMQIKLKRVPEWNTYIRETLIRKIELLKIIRDELKILIRSL